mmetsp:Transcript_24974/g.48744  ORF Transcript_24974/g.48744 Transcript_24974/m.48744 type:complete len:356 (+) Transcript_24974:96-1163(+)
MALVCYAIRPLVVLVFWWMLVDSLLHEDELQTCTSKENDATDTAQNLLHTVGLPRLTEVQRQASDGADIVETLREAVRLTGFKQSAVAKETASLFKLQTKRATGRVAYLIAGDAFRSSRRQLESSSCAEGSEGPQLEACQSQVNDIIKPLEQAGYDVSLYGVTYPCSGGEQLVRSLPDMYDGYMKGFALVERTNVTYGGQQHGWRAAVSQVMTDVNNATDWYDYYIISRWDLVTENHSTPEFWKCVLDGQPVARHFGHLTGYTTDSGWGHLNMDFIMVVPGILMANLYSMLLTNPERCCETSYMGPACVNCADNLNGDAGTTEAAPKVCPFLEASLRLSKNAPPVTTVSPPAAEV